MKPKSSKTKRWWVLAIILALWLGAGIVACLGLAGRLGTLSPSIQEWRVATALVGLSLTVLFLSRLPQSPALLQDLKTVERRLALGQVTVSEAQEKADRILHGLTLSDIMQPYVRSALHDLDRLESEHKEFAAQIAVLRDAIGDSKGEYTEVQMTTINTLLRGVDGKSDDVVMAHQKMKKSMLQLKQRELLLSRMTPHLADEITAVMSDVQSAVARVDEASTQAKCALGQLKSQVQEALNTAKKALDATSELAPGAGSSTREG